MHYILGLVQIELNTNTKIKMHLNPFFIPLKRSITLAVGMDYEFFSSVSLKTPAPFDRGVENACKFIMGNAECIGDKIGLIMRVGKNEFYSILHYVCNAGCRCTKD